MKDKDLPPPADRPPGEPKQSGRVAYDSKGNPTWEWETSTGVFDRDVSTQRLKTLEAKLTLQEETDSVPTLKGLALQDPDRMPGGGINPYDTGGVSTSDEPVKHPALAHKQTKHRPISNSLASKYANVAKNKAAAKQQQPQGIWQKIRAIFTGK